MPIKVAIITLVLFTACAQRIKVPINRMMSPEVSGIGAEVDYQATGMSQGVLDFSNDDTDNALLMSTVSEKAFNLALGPIDQMDMFINIPNESSSRFGIKVQLIGAPKKANTVGNKLAFTLATGASEDNLEDGYTIKMKSRLKDYAIIHGYRFSPQLLMYESLSITQYIFKGTIEDAGDLNSDKISYLAENILGGHIGFIFGASNLNLKAEIGLQKIKWSNTGEKIFYSYGYALSAGF